MGYILSKFKLKSWIKTIIILILTFGQVAFTMQIVQNIGFLTRAVQEKSTTEVWQFGLTIALFAVLLAAVQVVIQFLASKTASEVVTDLRGELYAKVNGFAIADFAEFSTESLITRSTNDLQHIHLTVITALRTAFVAPITMVWSIILLINFATASLSIVSMIWLFVLVAAVVVLLIMLTPKYTAIQRLTDGLNIVSRENLTGLRVVRAFNAEDYQEKKFDGVNQEFTKAQIFAGKAISIFMPIVLLVMNGLSASILWVSAHAINGLEMATAQAAFASINPFIMLATQIVMSFVLLVALIIYWPRANVCGKRLRAVITHDISVQDPKNPVSFKDDEKGTIEFRNVGYAYPTSEKEVVSGISFKAKKGEVVAFIGATGSGKTTVINLIPRMADCSSGEVLVDGVNVKDVKQEELRRKIGYVPQRGFLFKGNIRENIAFCDPSMSLNEVKAAAKIAEADEFVSNKRNEYDSEVAQGGTNFSGGQKQRLCIARAVAKKPEILIFDDSFSALDYKTDKTVRGNIAREMPDATRVIIAQRVGTIMDADQIIVLDHGKVVGHGKHSELIRNCAVYQEIALSQLSKEELGL